MTESPAEPASPGLGLVHEHGRSLRVLADGQEIARYVYHPWDAPMESPRPYFHPLRTRGGDLVSLYRPHDHVWHKGLSWSLANVGPHNFWGGPTYLRGREYVQLDNDGSMDHAHFDDVALRAGRVHVAETLRWHTAQGERLIDEHRRFVIALADDPGSWVLSYETTMTNVGSEALDLGSPTTQGRHNAGYGGLFWRGPRSFTGGRIHMPSRTGADELMGERSPWVAFTGQHDGAGGFATLAFVDAPDNPGHPTQWFLRSEIFGCVCPAPFFSTETRLSPDASLRLRYGVVIADGEHDADSSAKLAQTGLDALAVLEESGEDR